MDLDIALLLTVDGIANGAIYVLIALGTVLIFSVTRVMFVPFGDIAAFTALTLASIQMGRLPGTVWLVSVLAALAVAMELGSLWRAGRLARAPAALVGYGLLPMIPVALAVATVDLKLSLGLQMLLAHEQLRERIHADFVGGRIERAGIELLVEEVVGHAVDRESDAMLHALAGLGRPGERTGERGHRHGHLVPV